VNDTAGTGSLIAGPSAVGKSRGITQQRCCACAACCLCCGLREGLQAAHVTVCRTAAVQLLPPPPPLLLLCC